MGLLNPSKGNVKVDDRDIHNDKQAWQMNIDVFRKMCLFYDT